MPSLPVPAHPTESDYEAIEAAVMETMRGRWFLAEYAKRNRQADTSVLLAALDRIESVIRNERTAKPEDRVRDDLIEMSKAISRTKAEIASIKPDAAHHGKFGEATEELDSIVASTETATSDILAAAEQIQEIAWTLREHGVEPEVCDLLDTKATDVYTACSFQDLTGQRTRKVIQVMRYLEGRINAMIGIWGLDGAMAAEAKEAEKAREGDAALLNGPALPGQGLDQSDVDMVMGPAVHAAAAAAELRDDLAIVDVEITVETAAPETTAVETTEAPLEYAATLRSAYAGPFAEAPLDSYAHEADAFEPDLIEIEPEADLPAAAEPETAAPATAMVAEPEIVPVAPIAAEPRRESWPAPRPVSAHDPLAPIMALSDDEKLALFS
jgi:chemotaxis regulatin CheY-phosphate phosphatase CheZ